MISIVLVIFFAIVSNVESFYYVNKVLVGIHSSSSRTLLNAGKPVSVSFEPSGKSIIAEQNDLIGDVAKKAGVNIPFGCKQGRCNSCEVRLNGRGIREEQQYYINKLYMQCNINSNSIIVLEYVIIIVTLESIVVIVYSIIVIDEQES